MKVLDCSYNCKGDLSLQQRILPAASNMKDFERFLRSSYEIGVVLETHIGQIKHITQMAKQANKKVFLHVDLINGLKNDEYGTQFLCQEYRPFGLVSTKTSVIQQAKKNGIISVQRMFMLDSHALERSYKMIEKAQPDYIEVLPGAMPGMITEVRKRVNVPIFAGGLIRTIEDAEQALMAGATSITTSQKELWDHFRI